MNNTELANTEASNNNEQTTRLVYEPPVLTAYSQSQITMGGAKARSKDFVGGGTTTYKS